MPFIISTPPSAPRLFSEQTSPCRSKRGGKWKRVPSSEGEQNACAWVGWARKDEVPRAVGAGEGEEMAEGGEAAEDGEMEEDGGVAEGGEMTGGEGVAEAGGVAGGGGGEGGGDSY